MVRWLAILALTLAAALASAQRTWLGIYLREEKIGYSSLNESVVDGKRVSESLTVIDGTMLGQKLELRATGRTVYGVDGAPVRMEFENSSGGRTLRVDSEVVGGVLRAKSTFQGTTTTRDVPLPTDAPIKDDALGLVLAGDAAGTVRAFYLFDPNTLSFVKCEAVLKGPAKVTVGGKEFDATHIELRDPRSPMQVYVSAKGDLIKAVGPFGMELRPEDEERAKQIDGSADLAEASRIVPDRPIADYERTTRLTLRVTGADLSRLPSDEHQTVRQEGDAWVVEVHPPAPLTGEARVASDDVKWTTSDTRMPVGSARFLEIVREATEGAADLPEKVERLRRLVLTRVRANAGIGVLREADEVYDSAEGVCRDHAVLLGTLLRTAGIPTRLVSGLVYGDGAFYYHAWVEVRLDGEWYGVDSTRSPRRIDATHVKVGQGTIGQAFTSFLLDGARIQVLRSER